MNFSELCAEVYSITGRPDRVAETESAVRSATLKCHQSEFYPKDLVEVGISFPDTNYTHSLDYRATFPLWRSMRYMRKYDLTTASAGNLLEVIDTERVFDRYAIQRTDVCYLAGQYIQILSSTEDTSYIVGYYANPNITSVGFSSWIALDHPYAIIHDACATVFKTVGRDEEASAYRAMVAEQLRMIQISNVGPVGY